MQLGLLLRRYSRFTLRSLLCGLTAICIWASLNAHRASEQRKAIKAVFQLGGRISSDLDSLEQSDGVLRYHTRNLLFYSFCDPILEVSLAGCDVADSDLSFLRRLPNLKSLNLTGNPRLRGSGLRHIQGSRTIETLQAQMTRIDDTAIHHIVSLENLEELYLGYTLVGDDGIGLMTELNKLETLDLGGTNVTDRSLQSVRKLPQLAELYIAGTRVTDSGLRELAGMRSLRQLTLGCFKFAGGQSGWTACAATDKGVAEFKRKTPWCEVSY